eukprot:g17961.t1
MDRLRGDLKWERKERLDLEEELTQKAHELAKEKTKCKQAKKEGEEAKRNMREVERFLLELLCSVRGADAVKGTLKDICEEAERADRDGVSTGSGGLSSPRSCSALLSPSASNHRQQEHDQQRSAKTLEEAGAAQGRVPLREEVTKTSSNVMLDGGGGRSVTVFKVPGGGGGGGGGTSSSSSAAGRVAAVNQKVVVSNEAASEQEKQTGGSVLLGADDVLTKAGEEAATSGGRGGGVVVVEKTGTAMGTAQLEGICQGKALRDRILGFGPTETEEHTAPPPADDAAAHAAVAIS